jgi:hypothetical protein
VDVKIALSGVCLQQTNTAPLVLWGAVWSERLAQSGMGAPPYVIELTRVWALVTAGVGSLP